MPTTSPLGRVIEITEDGRHLAKDRGFMVVQAGREEVGRVPLDDIAAVIATARGTSLSTPLIAALAERGTPLVLCGENFAPTALVFPLAGHHAQQRRMEAQIDRTRPMAKRLWAQCVIAKLRAQAAALAEAGQSPAALLRMAAAVRSGDPDNLEAQGARRYWPLMLGEDFRRDIALPGANGLLNYGYAVLRAGIARGICAAGLHPGLGIFHRHPHNPMPLADDLMEPFRPLVDAEVRTLLAEGVAEVTVGAKRHLAGILVADLRTDLGMTPLSTCLLRCAQSLSESYIEGVPRLVFPHLQTERRHGSPDETEPDPEDERQPFGLSDHVAVCDVRPASDDQAGAQGGSEIPPVAPG
jgi:CRISPR-associated protein Cas1